MHQTNVENTCARQWLLSVVRVILPARNQALLSNIQKLIRITADKM